jgi:HK97 family phage major capsid protein
MANVMELRTKRAQLWEGAKAFLDSHTDKDGKLSAEDAAAYDKMEADVVALGKDIERLERQAAIDAELAKPTTEPIVNKPAAAVPEKKGRAADEYRKAMIAAIRSNFRNVSNVLQEGVDADGYALFSTPAAVNGKVSNWEYNHALGQCWYASIGVKYIFN